MKLSEKYKDYFQSQIISRGISYFKEGEVTKCFKTDDGYISKVSGSYGQEYTIKIKEDDLELEMSCTCPYEDNCKHEYATLLAIDNNKYREIKLLPEIIESTYDIVDLIRTIPSSELKDYIIKRVDDKTINISLDDIKETFTKYLPKESRDYYYNNLYNTCVIENILPKNIIYKYIDIIRKYIDNKDYEYTFMVISASIDAICDSNIKTSTDSLIDIYTKLGMYTRICYRKGNDYLKSDIDKWIDKYMDSNYNDDVYLEDLFMTIK